MGSFVESVGYNKPERVFGLQVRCRKLDIFKWFEKLLGIFLEFLGNFGNFSGFFWRNFLGEMFWEKFFGRIFFWKDFLGGFFWEDFFEGCFCEIFLVGILWEELLSRN